MTKVVGDDKKAPKAPKLQSRVLQEGPHHNRSGGIPPGNSSTDP